MILKIKNKLVSFFKKHGIKAAIGIFVFYLVRDVTLYILLPWLLFNNFIK